MAVLAETTMKLSQALHHRHLLGGGTIRQHRVTRPAEIYVDCCMGCRLLAFALYAPVKLKLSREGWGHIVLLPYRQNLVYNEMVMWSSVMHGSICGNGKFCQIPLYLCRLISCWPERCHVLTGGQWIWLLLTSTCFTDGQTQYLGIRFSWQITRSHCRLWPGWQRICTGLVWVLLLYCLYSVCFSILIVFLDYRKGIWSINK